MPHDIDPSALVNIPCPECGGKTALSQTSPRLRCAACDIMFAVNSRKMMAILRAAE